jgi:hypothetical protein
MHLLLLAQKKSIGVVSGEGIGWVAVHACACFCLRTADRFGMAL